MMSCAGSNFIFAATILALIAGHGIAAFNYSRCPSSSEIWAQNKRDPTKVPRTFSREKLAPTAPATAKYFELALHDWTQKPACPNPTCITSEKTYDPSLKQINDTFGIRCFGLTYYPALRFNETDTPGSLLGWWGNPYHVTPQHGWIHDTVVDFNETADGKGYDWALEFQCIEALDHVVFVGINFYSRRQTPGQAYINQYLQVARDHGLGIYMDHGMGITIVNQTDCS